MKMRMDVLTLFPEMFEPLRLSILGRAQRDNKLTINVHNIRDYSEDKHKKCDDYPFGGGAGMVMTAQPIVSAVEAIDPEHRARRIFLSPKGETFRQQKVFELLEREWLILLCGHYEGVDERAIEICIDEEMDEAADEKNLSLLADATRGAIAKLQERSDKGFFLMVEGAKIDYAGHSRCLPGSVLEMLSFDLAIAEALKFADSNGETLVVVTADHETGGLTLIDGDEATGRIMGVYVSDDHTPVMLPVFAYGPGSDRFRGTYRNTEIPRRIKSLVK